MMGHPAIEFHSPDGYLTSSDVGSSLIQKIPGLKTWGTHVPSEAKRNEKPDINLSAFSVPRYGTPEAGLRVYQHTLNDGPPGLSISAWLKYLLEAMMQIPSVRI